METINLSKIRREKMLSTISDIKKNITDENMLNNLSLIENELTKKKYGLIWEEHEERVDKELETKIPTFEDIKDKQIKYNNSKYNFLLEGDNLHSLYLLEKTHKNKIDVIYIDPPYNTGNQDFAYNDKILNSDDEYKHSKWLSFMEKRLKIAKRLLKNNGVIFISIDKNEASQLKLLMDDIFGEDSFVADLHIETSVIGGPRRIPAMAGSVVKTTEFVYGYVNGPEKKIMKQPKYDYIPGYDTHYSLFWNGNRFVKFVDVIKTNKEVVKIFDALNLKVSLNNLSKIIQVSDIVQKWVYSDEIAMNIYRKGDDTIDIPQNILKEYDMNSLIEYNNQLVYKVDDSKCCTLFRYKDRIGKCDDYFSNYGERSIRGNLWKGFSADGGNLAKEGGVSFKSGKKPIRLIKQLISSVTDLEKNKEITVLDFFAGSGTTGEAVLELNLEDGGNRNFILCTNNENNICEDITYKRILNAINGYKNKKGFKSNLKYYKTSYIPRINTDEEDLSKNLMINIKNLIQLENGIEIDDKIVRVILSEEEIDKFTSNDKELNECEKLYISSDILLTSRQSQIFKDFNIELFIIPEYYFEDEIREVA